MSLRLSLESWSAWSPGKPHLTSWQAWADGVEITTENEKPDISFVPAMQRRRISSLSRMALAAAADCCKGRDTQPCCIFASRHGELARTVRMIQDIVNHEEVSPTDFSLSVHNTAVGLYSIFTHNTSPSSMVVGGEDTFGNALIEASTYLARFPEQRVLLVLFDEPIPEPIREVEASTGEAFSIAFLLSAVGRANVEVRWEHNHQGISDGKDLGLEFLKFYLSGFERGTTSTHRKTWTWSRL